MKTHIECKSKLAAMQILFLEEKWQKTFNKQYHKQRWADRYFGPLVRCLLPSGLPK
jgi:hypothetical protein